MNILHIVMDENDANAKTIGDYLRKLLSAVWDQGESFSGKRPFGNSGWEYELYIPLVREGIIEGEIDDYGCLENCDQEYANKLIFEAIDMVFDKAMKDG